MKYFQPYEQLVQCDYLWRQHDLYGVERQLGDGLLLHPPKFKERSSLKPMQYPMHVDPLIDKMKVVNVVFLLHISTFNVKFSASYHMIISITIRCQIHSRFSSLIFQ